MKNTNVSEIQKIVAEETEKVMTLKKLYEDKQRIELLESKIKNCDDISVYLKEGFLGFGLSPEEKEAKALEKGMKFIKSHPVKLANYNKLLASDPERAKQYVLANAKFGDSYFKFDPNTNEYLPSANYKYVSENEA